MPTGLKVPVTVNRSGGAAIEKDELKNTQKILDLAFSEGDDKNPFQDLGIEDNLIFSIDNPAFRGRVTRAIESILAKFPDAVQLTESEPITFEKVREGELQMSLKYIDLLTGRQETFTKLFTR